MIEKFKTPVSRMTLAAWVGCTSVAALGTVFPAAASATAASTVVQAAAASAVVQPATAPTPASTPGLVAGFSFVKSLGGIDEYRLDSNGLTVLLVPDHSAPVVTFQVTYQVGSRNEVTGTTGATHILEHMMFKGSEGFNDPKGNSIKQFLERWCAMNTSAARTIRTMCSWKR